MGSAVAPEAPATPAAPVTPPAAPAAPVTPPAAPVTPATETPVAPAKEANPNDPGARPGAPEKYELQLPKDSALDPAVLERTAAIARARGLTNEQAQATVNLLHEEVASREAALLAAHAPGGEAWTAMRDGWLAETLADPALGKTPQEREAAIQRGHLVFQKYGEAHPTEKAAMKSFLNDSGLGDHPAAARFFAWLGKAMGESPIHSPNDGGGGGQRPPEEVMYPNDVPKK